MSRHYLDVPFRSKDAAKALGARFDGAVKRWYVEDGLDLAAFSAWLPLDARNALASTPSQNTIAPASDSGTAAMSLPRRGSSDVATLRRGIPLSQLLNSVGAAVARAFEGGVWTLVEVNEATARNGHVYLELSERDSAGQPIARVRAMIWANTAARILPDFEQATGAVIGAGIKLLVHARPVFKAQYGFSLEIDAIDPDYTLGDLEARKKEIRERLHREGVFDRNRSLAPAWDFRVVLVIAPREAAGLGDFQKEAKRLARFGVCRFVYAHSRFQGEGAAGEIAAAALQALRDMQEPPDAIALIRGGGAVNDLAWLNDYLLARFICDQEIPVLTGIGHERDSTLADEVAHTRFDTPSKVVAGIEQQILRRAREASSAWQAIASESAQAARAARLAIERRQSTVTADARLHLASARQRSDAEHHRVAVHATRQVHVAARETLALRNELRSGVLHDLAAARKSVPSFMTSIRIGSLATLAAARAQTQAAQDHVLQRSGAAAQRVAAACSKWPSAPQAHCSKHACARRR